MFAEVPDRLLILKIDQGKWEIIDHNFCVKAMRTAFILIKSRSLEVSALGSETKGSRFKFGC